MQCTRNHTCTQRFLLLRSCAYRVGGWCARSAGTPSKVLIWCKSWKNTSKSGQNLWKPSQTPWKYWAKMPPIIFWFKKNWCPIFEEVCENSGKNHSQSQKFACSYTYVLTPSVNFAFRPESGFKNKCRSRAVFGLMISDSVRVQTSK